ncbi:MULTISPECIES: tyrosine-type recombinase/integrase [unclassified Lysinibacillus]|uniref:tyrosine-type recombinase/integrase n=1 Tax=Lysinibacillus sp. AC-3 TaxID=1680467 RepID=UPI00148284C3
MHSTEIHHLLQSNFDKRNESLLLDTAWRRIIEKYNLPKLNFHALRHASYMVSKNVNFKIIQEQLGHSDIKMTINIYSHLTSKDKNKASDYFDDLI